MLLQLGATICSVIKQVHGISSLQSFPFIHFSNNSKHLSVTDGEKAKDNTYMCAWVRVWLKVWLGPIASQTLSVLSLLATPLCAH
jgi:hypothetical protein